MGLFGDVIGGAFKIGGTLIEAGINAFIQGAKEADHVRKSASTRGMSDRELLDGYMNRNNSWGARAGYGMELKNRYRR